MKHLKNISDDQSSYLAGVVAICDVFFAGGQGRVGHSVPELVLGSVNGGAAPAHACSGPKYFLLHHGQRAPDALPPELSGSASVASNSTISMPQLIRRHDVGSDP